MDKENTGNAENSFRKFGKKIDALIEELKDMKERAKVEYADQIDELKRNKETLKKEWDEFSQNDKWDVVEEKLENAGREMKEAFKAAFKKKEKES